MVHDPRDRSRRFGRRFLFTDAPADQGAAARHAEHPQASQKRRPVRAAVWVVDFRGNVRRREASPLASLMRTCR
jgi:hypothetical protein